MSDHPTFTRRQFLHAGLAMLSTVGSVPAFLPRAASAMADTSMRVTSKAGVPEERVLVVVQLSGGNDGLNTVVPFGMREYYNARPGIAVPRRDLLVVDNDNGIGLNPAMRGVHEMMGDRRATILQGVGYPNPNRSHFASMDIWHSGITNDSGRGNRGHGWIGRALDKAYEAQVDANAGGASNAGMACISLGSDAPLALQGRDVRPVAFQSPNLFRWHGTDHDRSLARSYDAISQPADDAPPAATNDPTDFVFRTAMDAQVASAQVRRAAAQQPITAFPNSPLSRQLQTVSAMIRAELPTRVYYVAMGGFDTHANQLNPHQNLLRQFSEAMHAFYNELDALDQAGRVVTMAFSEFGRRTRQNASAGTDHGAAGPMFLFGDHARPGLVGRHPSLSQVDQAGDMIHHTDFRTVYRDVLENWMQLDTTGLFTRETSSAGILRA
ncbi:MAG: DUF1501 domain-containing protein [Phycisphaeraceae bacterium]